MRCPPPLRPGDVVRVIAPSSPFDRTLFFRGLGFLSRTYRVTWSRRLFERRGYLAGDDESRRDELQEAVDDREAAAIVAARGGYGAGRICHRVDFSALDRHPRWFVGFSDVTAIHLELTARGVCSIHASNVTSLGRGHAPTRDEWRATLEAPGAARTLGDLRVLHGGSARGVLCGGNLTLLATCAIAGRLRLPRGAVLFVEEVNEAPYRLDRMLSSLVVGGHLDQVAAVVVGELVGCSPPARPERALEAVAQALEPLGIPVAAGVPSGHGTTNQPLLLGGRAELSSERRALVLGAPLG